MQAQEGEAEYQQFGIKFLPSFLFDFTGPSLEGGLEYRFAENWSIQQDFGYISTWDERYFIRVDDIEGFRLRTSIKRFTYDDGGYQALALGYKNVMRFRSETYCREDCAYFEEIDREVLTHDFSAHYLFGIKSEVWNFGIIEVSGGAGLRAFRRTSSPALPEDAFIAGFERSGLRIREDRWFVIPSILLCLQVGFGI